MGKHELSQQIARQSTVFTLTKLPNITSFLDQRVDSSVVILVTGEVTQPSPRARHRDQDKLRQLDWSFPLEKEADGRWSELPSVAE